VPDTLVNEQASGSADTADSAPGPDDLAGVWLAAGPTRSRCSAAARAASTSRSGRPTAGGEVRECGPAQGRHLSPQALAAYLDTPWHRGRPAGANATRAVYGETDQLDATLSAISPDRGDLATLGARGRQVHYSW